MAGGGRCNFGQRRLTIIRMHLLARQADHRIAAGGIPQDILATTTVRFETINDPPDTFEQRFVFRQFYIRFQKTPYRHAINGNAAASV